jgi:hypothetical protein
MRIIGALSWCLCAIMVQTVVVHFCSKDLKLLICTSVHMARIMQLCQKKCKVFDPGATTTGSSTVQDEAGNLFQVLML